MEQLTASLSEQNKEIILDFVKLLGTNKIDELTAFLHEDLTWIIPQDPKYSAMAGSRNKQGWIGLYTGFISKMPKGARYEVIGITAENERVALEAESFAETPLGEFHNRYHFLFVLKDGKILVAKEYADSLFMHKFKQKNLDFFIRLIKNKFKK